MIFQVRNCYHADPHQITLTNVCGHRGPSWCCVLLGGVTIQELKPEWVKLGASWMKTKRDRDLCFWTVHFCCY